MSQQPATASSHVPSHSAGVAHRESPLNALQELPESALVTVVRQLPLRGKRALRSTCRSMRSFVDVHVLHTLHLGRDAELALSPPPTASAETAAAWHAVQRRSYQHITCLTFTGCKEAFVRYFMKCVTPSLQHLQEVRIASSANAIEAVLTALLDVHSSAETGASCTNQTSGSTNDAVASGLKGSSSSAALGMTATCGAVSGLTASCDMLSPPTTNIEAIHFKVYSLRSPPYTYRHLLPVLGKFTGLRTLHMSGYPMFPPKAAGYSALSSLHALSSLAADVSLQLLAFWPSLQRLRVTRGDWGNYSSLNSSTDLRSLTSLTDLRSLTLAPLTAAQMKQLAVHLPPTLTEFKMLRLHRHINLDLKLEVKEAWHLCYLARLDVPTLNVSCNILTGLVRLTMLSCNSLNEHPSQAGRAAWVRLKAARNAACLSGQNVSRAVWRSTTAPSSTMLSLRELRLHDSGLCSGALPHMCPALTHVTIHCYRNRADVQAISDAGFSATAGQLLFSAGELSGLQFLNLPMHLLSHESVLAACANITSLSCSTTYLSDGLVDDAATTIVAMQHLQQLKICCLAHSDPHMSARESGENLLQAAAGCSRLTELEFHGAGATFSAHGFASLVAAPALRLLKLRAVHLGGDILRSVGSIAESQSLRYLEVECRSDLEAVELAVYFKPTIVELVVYVRKDIDEYAGIDEYAETDHEELDISDIETDSDDGDESGDEGGEDEESE